MGQLGPSPVVVVTGASAGIGRATVRELARRGARLAAEHAVLGFTDALRGGGLLLRARPHG